MPPFPGLTGANDPLYALARDAGYQQPWETLQEASLARSVPVQGANGSYDANSDPIPSSLPSGGIAVTPGVAGRPFDSQNLPSNVAHLVAPPFNRTGPPSSYTSNLHNPPPAAPPMGPLPAANRLRTTPYVTQNHNLQQLSSHQPHAQHPYATVGQQQPMSAYPLPSPQAYLPPFHQPPPTSYYGYPAPWMPAASPFPGYPPPIPQFFPSPTYPSSQYYNMSPPHLGHVSHPGLGTAGMPLYTHLPGQAHATYNPSGTANEFTQHIQSLQPDGPVIKSEDSADDSAAQNSGEYTA